MTLSYIGIKGHFVTYTNYKLHSVMLARKICGSHTAENICACSEDSVASYQLSEKNPYHSDWQYHQYGEGILSGFECDDDDSEMDIYHQWDGLFATIGDMMFCSNSPAGGQGWVTIPGPWGKGFLVAHVCRCASASQLLGDLPKRQSAKQIRWNSRLMMIGSIPTTRLEMIACVLLFYYKLQVLL